MSKSVRREAGQRFAGAEMVLAVLVVVVIALMIVPLPTWALDLLISLNLASAIAILLVVLYVSDAVGIATFPTLLLLTTLFRLSLNVASTRLILLQANAGDVIKAFGTFVVRGNYVVGAVVFLVLTLIQFIVIAKGSERVAEVGARFALDAMPGKQMAIDAELRGGTIDGAEAKRRRRLLQRESQFYGAMDGAMKFVKGDVIASLIILVVNILGGLTIGVGMKGMPALDALKRYGLLTIGDGLVTQIPALVLSISAGVLVTRVASEEANTPLGEELSKQLLGVPKALMVAGALVCFLALVPGLPSVPFLVIGAALFLVGRARARAKRIEEQQAVTDSAPKERRVGEQSFVPYVVPWSMEVSPDLEGLNEHGFRTMAIELRDRLFIELGVPLPMPRVRVRQELAERQVLLMLHEVPARLVVVPGDLEGEKAVEWIREQSMDLLRGRAQDFLGLSEVQRLLDELEQVSPATVRNVTPKPVSLVILTDVLRRLVEERISVRDLRAILEALSSIANTEKDPLSLAEYVRSQFRRVICFRVCGPSKRLECIILDSLIEDTVRRHISRTAAGAFLTLSPQAGREVSASLRAVIASVQSESRPAVILTQPDIRRFVRKLIEVESPEVPVVSFAELLPEIVVKPIARAVPIQAVTPAPPPGA